MKILAIDKTDWKHPGSGGHPEIGGSKIFLREVLTRMAEEHDVELLSTNFVGAKRKEEMGGVSVKRTGIPVNGNSVINYLLMQFYINYHAQVVDPDAVVCFNSPLPWFLVGGWERVTVFHHINGRKFFDFYGFPKNLVLYALEAAGIFKEKGKKVVSVSPSTAEKLEAAGHSGEDVVEVRNGVDTDEYVPGKKSEKPKILYLGLLERRKGADRLPEIFEALDQQLDDFTFHVAGSGRLEERISDYSEGKEGIEFHGFVREEEKKRLLQEAWVVIVPSRVEGFGLVVLEANASGTPVVASDTEGLRDAVEDGRNGFLSDADNPERFAGEVARIIMNQKLRESLASGARELAEEHSWDSSVERLEKLLEEVQNKNNS